MVLDQWWGLMAPTSSADRIRTELLAALGHPSVRERLRVLAVEKQSDTDAEFARFRQKERARLTAAAQRAGLKPE